MKKLYRGESGQVLAIFALALVALLGFSALAIDIGMSMYKRAELQKAADAAALAGIMDIWTTQESQNKGINTAKVYATNNGAAQADAQVMTSYADYVQLPDVVGAPIFLGVQVESEVNHFFGPIIGHDSSVIRAEAVAVKVVEWKGESLPFINLGDDPKIGSEIILWDKEAPGDKEAIAPVDRSFSEDPYPHFIVNYGDGLTIQKGKDSSIKGPLSQIWNYYQLNPTQRIYTLSLSPEAHKRGYFTVEEKNGNQYKIKLPIDEDDKEKPADGYKAKLDNNDTIVREDLVLLEVVWTFYEKEPGLNEILRIEVKNIYKLDEVPDSYDGLGRIISYLIK